MKKFKEWILTIVLLITFAAFTTLKLTSIISWSWWWVFSPIFALAIVYAFVIYLIVTEPYKPPFENYEF